MERILGPYFEAGRNRYRVIEITGDGSKVSRAFRSEKDAERYVEILKAGIAQLDRTTDSLTKRYIRELRERGLKERSIERTEWALASFFPKPLPLAALSPSRCQGLYDDLRTRPSKTTGEPLAPDSHRASLKETKTFLRWCVDGGHLKEHPATKVKGVGKLRPRGKSLGKSGYKMRIKDARVWFGAALEMVEAGDSGAVAGIVAVLLGLRASEIVGLVCGNLDEDERPGDVIHVEDRKNEKDLTLEVPELLSDMLLKLVDGREPGDPIFRGRGDQPHTRQWVRDQVHRVCRKAGIPNATAHSMRGLIATLLSKRGIAAQLIADQLGNDPEVMRRHYAEPGAEEAGEVVEGLKLLQGGKTG
jgi:integrase